VSGRQKREHKTRCRGEGFQRSTLEVAPGPRRRGHQTKQCQTSSTVGSGKWPANKKVASNRQDGEGEVGKGEREAATIESGG